jgi:signal transduction histidine kinase
MRATSSASPRQVTQPSLPAIQRRSGLSLPGSLAREILRWAVAIALAFGMTLAVFLTILHPSRQDSVRLILYLGLGGLGSIGLGVAALLLVDKLSIGGIRLKVAVPPFLTALVIAFNVLLIAKLMFISTEDGQLLLAFLIFGIATAALLSSSIAARMTKSIRGLGAGAMRLAEGDYSFRITEPRVSSEDELSQLTHWFNQMADSVQSAFEHQKAAECERKHVVAAVSHDLRTPLASVRAMIEAIDDGIVTDPATLQRYHHAMRAELRHLTTLLDDLFELSRIEAGALSLERACLSIEDLISDALEGTHEQAEQAQIRLIGQVDARLPTVHIDARQMYRALANLLQNAIRHTPAGGIIFIRAARLRQQDTETGGNLDNAILIQVIDSGEGIAAKDLPHIFDRTYRGEPSRHRMHGYSTDTMNASTGAGLGLAITRGIIEAHGGQITAESPLSPATVALVNSVTAGKLSTPGTLLSFTVPLDKERDDYLHSDTADGRMHVN